MKYLILSACGGLAWVLRQLMLLVRWAVNFSMYIMYVCQGKANQLLFTNNVS